MDILNSIESIIDSKFGGIFKTVESVADVASGEVFKRRKVTTDELANIRDTANLNRKFVANVVKTVDTLSKEGKVTLDRGQKRILSDITKLTSEVDSSVRHLDELLASPNTITYKQRKQVVSNIGTPLSKIADLYSRLPDEIVSNIKSVRLDISEDIENLLVRSKNKNVIGSSEYKRFESLLSRIPESVNITDSEGNIKQVKLSTDNLVSSMSIAKQLISEGKEIPKDISNSIISEFELLFEKLKKYTGGVIESSLDDISKITESSNRLATRAAEINKSIIKDFIPSLSTAAATAASFPIGSIASDVTEIAFAMGGPLGSAISDIINAPQIARAVTTVAFPIVANSIGNFISDTFKTMVSMLPDAVKSNIRSVKEGIVNVVKYITKGALDEIQRIISVSTSKTIGLLFSDKVSSIISKIMDRVSNLIPSFISKPLKVIGKSIKDIGLLPTITRSLFTVIGLLFDDIKKYALKPLSGFIKDKGKNLFSAIKGFTDKKSSQREYIRRAADKNKTSTIVTAIVAQTKMQKKQNKKILKALEDVEDAAGDKGSFVKSAAGFFGLKKILGSIGGGAVGGGLLGGIGKGALKLGGKVLGPLAGIATLGTSLLTGEGLTAESIGGAIGTTLGGVIGTLLGPLGTVAGGVAGDYAGRWVGSLFSDNNHKIRDISMVANISKSIPESTDFIKKEDLAKYLATTAKIESNMNPLAKAPNSSATGLFQFTRKTGKEYGLIDESGKDLRTDPIASTKAAAKLAMDNAKQLQSLGINPTPENLYLAHQQGAYGAAEIIKAAEGKGTISPTVRANMDNNGGVGLSAAEFRDKFYGRYRKAEVQITPAIESISTNMIAKSVAASSTVESKTIKRENARNTVTSPTGEPITVPKPTSNPNASDVNTPGNVSPLYMDDLGLILINTGNFV